MEDLKGQEVIVRYNGKEKRGKLQDADVYLNVVLETASGPCIIRGSTVQEIKQVGNPK